MDLEQIMFESRTEFRNWLADHCITSSGIWLVFSKCAGIKTLKANEALEEAQINHVLKRMPYKTSAIHGEIVWHPLISIIFIMVIPITGNKLYSVFLSLTVSLIIPLKV